MTLYSLLHQRLTDKLSQVGDIHLQPVGGGSINDTFKVTVAGKLFFCKSNSATNFPHLFQKEKRGLQLLAQQGVIKTPAVTDCFEAADKQVLLLAWVQEGELTEGFWKTFGEQLAALHRVSNDSFGLHEDNYMGSVPQQNKTHHNWSSFFATERLVPLIQKCAAKGLLKPQQLAQFESLQNKLPSFFEEEKPSLLHGDLWSGNFMCNQDAEPVLIDPAVYFGHRSVDLAMTTLFGGFRRPFYEAYHHHFPLPPNHEEQWAVCNLYPLLIHLYLFGSGYLSQIEQTLKRFA